MRQITFPERFPDESAHLVDGLSSGVFLFVESRSQTLRPHRLFFRRNKCSAQRLSTFSCTAVGPSDATSHLSLRLVTVIVIAGVGSTSEDIFEMFYEWTASNMILNF